MMTKMKILFMFLMGSLSLARGDDDQCVATYRKMDLCAKTLLVFPKNTEFMGKTRARGKVFLANGDGEMLELNEELEKMELEQAELLAENVALKAEMLELQTIYSGIQGKHDLYFAPPNPPPPSPSVVIPDSYKNGLKCGHEGDANRVFVLRDGAVTEAACVAACENLDSCVAFSGIMRHSHLSLWCIGCQVELGTTHSGAVAYKKTSGGAEEPSV